MTAMEQKFFEQSRRRFFTTAAGGLGTAALASMLSDDGLLAAETPTNNESANPLAPKEPHFPGKAKACIFFYMAGGPSQVDLMDPKPVLNERDGQKVPKSIYDKVEFAFIKPEEAVLKGTKQKFQKHGECGTEFSNLLPHIGGCADDIALIRSMHCEEFNHHPAQLTFSTGKPEMGRPTVGSWLTYGLGSESRNLPGYVVLSAGRGASGGASNWSSGFLPSTYAGVPFRNAGEPVLNLTNPRGVSIAHQRRTLEALRELNSERLNKVGDSEIASRIAAYELAFRMQTAAPELIDISGETRQTLQAYGVDRATPQPTPFGQPSDTYQTFSKNCLLARRMVERGVRCVTVMHASWDQHGALEKDLAFNAGMTDQPVAALIKDLKQRGLLDSTLIVWGGEFGRTPLGQGGDGRDHHPHAYSLFMAGGGIKGGQVIGATDEIGWFPTEDPVHANDFQATLLHLFGFDHKKLSVRFKGLDVRLTNLSGNVVKKLLTQGGTAAN